MKLIVLTAPSGAGKTTIARRVMEEIPQLVFSVSATTRSKRPNERDGEDYYFLSEAEFRSQIDRNAFLEYEEVYPGRLYGTLRKEVERVARKHPVLFDVDVKGALSIKNVYADRVLAIFIKPPSLEVLAQRLHNRQTESEEEFARRIERSKMELGYADRFDAQVVNDDLNTAVRETLGYIRAFLKD